MNDPEYLHQNIFYSIIDGVLLISSSLTIQESNLTVEDMFHRSRDSFIHRGLAGRTVSPATACPRQSPESPGNRSLLPRCGGERQAQHPLFPVPGQSDPVALFGVGRLHSRRGHPDQKHEPDPGAGRTTEAGRPPQ